MAIKKLSFQLLFLLIVVFFFNGSVCAATVNQKIIQTYGEAEIAIQPDLVKISLSIETQSRSAKEAVEENARLTNSVLDALLRFGILKEDIKTSSYRLNSYRRWDSKDSQNEQDQIYYQAFNEIIVSSTVLEKAGDIIDLAVKAGANNINYINFELNDSQELILQTLSRATEQARNKAEAIALGAGIEIKQLLSVKEERSFYVPNRIQNVMFSRDTFAGVEPTPISADNIIISATVVAEFSF